MESLTKTTSYNYRVFGLEIESMLQCPELLTGGGGGDVSIHFGSVPSSLSGAKVKGQGYEAAQDRLLFTVDEVGRYLITDGNRVLIERFPGVEELTLRLYLLGSALGALLHQRGLLTLHGSAVATPTGCAIFLGESGMGKSTLAAAMGQRGYRLVTDDVCCIEIGEAGKPVIRPGYPQIKLWADAARMLGEEMKSLRRLHPDFDKGGLVIDEGFSDAPLPLDRVYLLDVGQNSHCELQPLAGFEKLSALTCQTYRWYFLEGLGQKIDHFQQCATLAKQIPLTRIIRPREGNCIDEVADLVAGDWA